MRLVVQHLYYMQIHLYNVHSSKRGAGEATGPPAIISQLENTTGSIVGILHKVGNKLRRDLFSSATAQRDEEMDRKKELKTDSCKR